MTFLLLLLALSLLPIGATLRAMRHDGRGPASPPTSHTCDPHFCAPSRLAH